MISSRGVILLYFNWFMAPEKLIDRLISEGYLKTRRIIDAFRKVDRQQFLLNEFRGDFELNTPLPIGYGQTNSQPLTVAFMLEQLQPQAGDRVLDVGSGSGWTTALLAEIVGPDGRVYAIECVPQLRQFGEANVKKFGFQNIEFKTGDGSQGWPERAPFDLIEVAAAAESVPEALIEQLAINGRLIIPVGTEAGQDLTLLTKQPNGQCDIQTFPGFAFVPLITSS